MIQNSKDSPELELETLLNTEAKVIKLHKIARIANFISQLPPDHALEKFYKTEDLRLLALELKRTYQILGTCFAVLALKDYGEIPDIKRTIRDSQPHKAIARRDVDIYEMQAKYWFAEWSLLEEAFPYLLVEITELGAYNDVSFFCKILEKEIVSSIKAYSEPYYEIKVPQRGRLFEKLYEVSKYLKDTEKQKLSNNKSVDGDPDEGDEVSQDSKDVENQKFLNNKLIYRAPDEEKVWKLIHRLSSHNQIIKKKWDDLIILHNDSSLAKAESCNTRLSSGKRLKSEVWKNGERYIQTRSGVKRLPYIEKVSVAIGNENEIQRLKTTLQETAQLL